MVTKETAALEKPHNPAVPSHPKLECWSDNTQIGRKRKPVNQKLKKPLAQRRF
jgi:hypothetical protein